MDSPSLDAAEAAAQTAAAMALATSSSSSLSSAAASASASALASASASDDAATHALAVQSAQHKIRFQLELEFVQCLANVQYLHYLGQQGYLTQTTFINYLKYLLYWKKPEYARFIRFPHCLYFLDLLQEPVFRTEITKKPCVDFVAEQQLWHWQFYGRNRSAAAAAAVAAAATAAAASTDASKPITAQAELLMPALRPLQQDAPIS
ncbi:mediator complex subunit 31-A [Capsaspora owczarzaki ATCC 30864]|uniref:Mediator of RNA polymerase II transcription subunit 31 n=1 Tax=Capsaspora owczarzaki (strain ATCC 30864) TaxID=595528 RepID=A0A0D2UFG0_CAPO3|nr:mediator complex subunit 31-A [Capsaspora owczarzaki ATCC 30864]KJE93861.1 mediator complex subunit 31-A [Capsaspora owczarzaki ATCC 30864]|eukprot:XP_004347332.1 mediator complex subunit 31-A [Capsaspora owczarzaki ATCC 30864]